MKQQKIMIYPSNTPKNKVISGNGIVLDNICIYAETDESIIDGNYTFDGTFLIDDENLWSYIKEEEILKVRLDYGEEIFRITSIKKNVRDIEVFARQITLEDSLRVHLADVRPTNQSGMGFMAWVLSNSNELKENRQYAKDLELFSDISTQNTAYYIEKSLYEALHSADNSFMTLWGGEVQRRGYTLRINKKIGTDRGVQIRSGKNLTGFEEDINLDSIITRIKPKGFNGITIDGYVSSPNIDKYSRVFTKEIKYEDVKVKDENNDEGFDTLAQAQAELIRRATKEFEVNKVDELKASYTVNFVDLSQTEEYKNFVNLERVYLGDTIRVYVEKLDIEITIRALARKYDVLRKMVKEITLSNEDLGKMQRPPTVGDIIGELDRLDEQAKDYLQEAKDFATSTINDGIKDSYVVVRKNEILIMNTTDINTATSVWRWNRGGLGYSSTGYYGQYGTAITNDGRIVADFINTGVLTAILLKSNDGKNWIDLSTGEICFNKGRILGKDVTIDLDNGIIETTSLDNNVNYNVKISNGRISSKELLIISSLDSVDLIAKDGNKIKASVEIMKDYMGKGYLGLNAEKISMGYSSAIVDLWGSISINGSPIQTQIANLENAMLMQEGLI